MKEIQLTKGQTALVDDNDYPGLSKYSWYATQRKSGIWYAARRDQDKDKLVYMHRVIMGLPDQKILVDHEDRNGLNNQRYNLRVADKSQNGANKLSRAGSSSKYMGVYWHNGAKKWTAQIRKNSHVTHLGLFINEQDAAIAYNLKASELHGEFANLNAIS